MSGKHQSKWRDFLNQKLMRKKSGFTLVELIVTIAIIGLLVLFAAPKFMDRAAEARRTNIVNDIAVAEIKVGEYLMAHDVFGPDWTPVVLAQMDKQKEDHILYDREGVVDSTGAIRAGEYVLLPTTFVKEEVHSKLKGDFYANENGDVYYGDTGKPVKDGNVDDFPADFNIPPQYELATDDDFIWVDTTDSDRWDLFYQFQDEIRIEERGSVDAYYEYLYGTMPQEMSGAGKSSDEISAAQDAMELSVETRANARVDAMDIGYFYYVGVAEYVIIPDTIKGKAVTRTYHMFGEGHTENYENYYTSVVKGVAANNPGITDMSHMFESSGAESLELLYLNTSNVTNMESMFNDADATSITFGDHFRTNKVTNMVEMFSWSSVVSLLLPETFDTVNVENMESMFSDTSMTELDLSFFDITKVTEMDYLFDSTTATVGYARTQAEADRLNDGAVTDIPDYLYFIVKGSGTKTPAQIDEEFRNSLPDGYVLADDADFVRYSDVNAPTKFFFKYVGTDEYVIIPRSIKSGWYTYKLTDYYSMFKETNVKGVASNNSNVTSTSYMFNKSMALTLDLRYLDTSNVTDMNYMFNGSDATVIDVSSLDTSSVTNMNRMFWATDALQQLDLSSFDTSNVTDMSSMFGYSAATTLDLSSFDTSSVTNMANMFDFSDATTIDVSSFNTSNVTNMSGMFSGTMITTLDLSSFDTSNVTNMREMFYLAKTLTTIDVSTFDTSNVTDMNGMFSYTTATTLDLSSFNTSSVTTMYRMFKYSTASTLDLSSFDTSNVTTMYEMFNHSSATTFDLSSFDTSKVTTWYEMFCGAKATTLDLSSFDISNGPSMVYFFKDSSVTGGYARTTADAEMLSSTSLFYGNVSATFVVK